MAALVLDPVTVGSQVQFSGVTYNVTQVNPPQVVNGNQDPGQLQPQVISFFVIPVGDTGFNSAADYAGTGNDAGGPV